MNRPTPSLPRRDFLKTSAVLAAAAAATRAAGAAGDPPPAPREYYELRVYRSAGEAGHRLVGAYLEQALVPALGRMGIDRVGVFTPADPAAEPAHHVLVPYPSLDRLAAVNPALLADPAYQDAAREYFAVPKDAPAVTRIHSRLYRAFAGMPVIELPARSAARQPRIFELRLYESHTEEKAALKVEMFNEGEIQVMRDCAMGPVFFGEALVADDLPHLAYMLSASDRDAHKAHWSTFAAHPEWVRMKDLPRYADTVSRITSTFLQPTAYSQV